MKSSFVLIIFLALASANARAADVVALFRELPTTIFKDVDRSAAIAGNEADASVLKLKLPSDFAGEFRVLADSPKETIVALSVYSCDASQFEVWSKRGANWKDISKSAAPKLAKADVTAMLAVSPVTVEKLGSEVGVSYFFSFAANNGLSLLVRRQNGCEIAGTARQYQFEDRRFVVK